MKNKLDEFKEKFVIEQINKMCEESLPPKNFEEWDKIKKHLKKNRESLRE